MIYYVATIIAKADYIDNTNLGMVGIIIIQHPEVPLTGGDGKCCNLYGDENLGRSGFDHSNLFKGQNQHAVNIERWLKSKLP